MPLEVELSFFNAHRDEWIAAGRKGQWAVVHRSELLGFFPSVGAGYEAGVARWGGVTFLVKTVTEHDSVERIIRAGPFVGGYRRQP